MKRILSIIIALIMLTLPLSCAQKDRILYRVVQTGSGADKSSGGYVAVYYRESDEAVTGIMIEARFDRNTFSEEDINILSKTRYFDVACKGFSELPFTEEEQLNEGDYFIMIARFRDLDDPANMAHMLDTTFIDAESVDEITDVEGFIAAMHKKVLREVPADEIASLGLHID